MENKEKPQGVIHVLLSQDYGMFFFSVVLGIIFDRFFSFNFFDNVLYEYIGLSLILLGSIIIYWAQRTTRTRKSEALKERDINFFYRGPYKFTRNPTNFALTIAVIGLGLIINSLFTVIFIIATYFLSKFVFIKKQDSILLERYGEVFGEYKKKVKNWL